MALLYTRVFIGPRYAEKDQGWNWTVVDKLSTNISDSVTPTSVNAVMSSVDTSVTVLDTSTFPNIGGIWISNEYMEYGSKTATSFDDLVRTAPVAHGPPESVKLWWGPIKHSGITFTKRSLSNYAVTDWTAEIRAMHVPPQVVASADGYYHSVLVEGRADHVSDWELVFHGWIEMPAYTDDGQHVRIADFSVVSISEPLNQHLTKSLTTGEIDLAAGSSADANRYLQHSWKERDSGELLTAVPKLDESSAIDRDPLTIYISDQMVGTSKYTSSPNDPHVLWDNKLNIWTQFVISHIYLQSPTGYLTEGYRFIELTIIPQPGGEARVRDHVLRSETNVLDVFCDIGGQTLKAADKIILCESQTLWEEQWPTNDAVLIVELDFDWDDIAIAGDSIAFQRLHGDEEWSHGVSWGTGITGRVVASSSSETPDWKWDRTIEDTPFVSAPSAGEAIAYNYKGTDGLNTSVIPKDYWELDDNPVIAHFPDDYTRDQKEFSIMLTLPQMQLTLAENITAAVPGNGAALKISNGVEVTNQGLDASGTIQIGSEQITYSSKTPDGSILVSARGANSTTPTSHLAGTPVQILDNGIMSDAFRINEIRIGWRAGAPYGWGIHTYATAWPQQRRPGTPNFADDWTYLGYITGGTALTDLGNNIDGYVISAADDRYSHVMFLIEKMSVDPGRVKISEIWVDPSDSTYDSHVWEADPDPIAHQVYNKLINDGGMHTSKIILWVTSPKIIGYTTETSNCFDVCSDMADFGSFGLNVFRDGEIETTYYTVWNLDWGISSKTWTRANANNIAISPEREKIDGVEILWRNYSDPTENSEIYPSGTDQRLTKTIGPVTLLDQTAATNYAQRAYKLYSKPATIILETDEDILDNYPNEVHSLSWEFLDEPITTIDAVVESIDHYFEGTRFRSVVNLRRIT